MNAPPLNDKNIELDEGGYMLDLNDWSAEVAQALAEQAGIELSPEHWEILELIRGFYQEFQLAPTTRPLIRYTALKLGLEKGNSFHLNHLFNGSPAKLAAKLAGLPKPINCL